MAVADWSTTAASNGSTLGIDIAEGCAAANLNNALRELMAQAKTKFNSLDTGDGSKQPLDATLTALAALTTAANKLPYATGSDAFATTDFSAYGRSLVGLASTAALLTLLGFAAVGDATSGHADIPFGSWGTLRINWGKTTVSGNVAGATANFHAAFSSAFGAVCSFQSLDVTLEQLVVSWCASTTQVGLTNGTPFSLDIFWIAIGKA